MTEDGQRRSLRIISQPVSGTAPALAPREPTGGGESADLLIPSAAAERLRLPGALAVTTGQQPGLFGGPMYVIHKALSARALARCLERRWSRPVVPVFWMAGDDHDWAEASRTAWWTAEGEVVDWTLAPREPTAPQRPMSAEPLPDEVNAARRRLAADLPAGASRDRALAWVDRHWHSGATLHGAFVTGIAELLEPLGIGCLDATAAAVKRAQRPLLRAALDHAGELDAALASLPDTHAWVGAGEGLSLVFLEANAGRDRLTVDGNGFRTRRSGEHFERPELDRLLEEAPERFSANVLLRPVVEAALLPTVAYMAGPGELGYLRDQAATLYPALGIAPQVPVPRWGGTVVDQVSTRLLDRLQLGITEVLADEGSLGRLMVRRDLDRRIPDAMAGLRAAVDRAADALQLAGRSIDSVLERAIESRRRKLHLVSNDLEYLMERHHKKRDGIGWAQFQRLRARVLPLDTRQERVIGVAGALGQWGDQWIAESGTAADTWAGQLLETTPPAA
jgi:bacillithiol biosynthesis cysteine-adding enzyme BshC